LPGPLPALRGVTGLRGQIVPVYDLAVLLGQERAQTPRWLLLVAGRLPLALAFDGFDGHVAAMPAQLLDAGVNGNGALRHDGALRPILDLQSLTGDIEQRIDLLQRTRSPQT
jgi:chemotaxis signal transduction protein